jgi:hypothetical protein
MRPSDTLDAPARRPSLIENIQGGIRVRLRRDGETSAVQLESSRPVHAVRVLLGLPVAGALQALPRLFGVCGHAHLAAAHAALGLPPPEAGSALRAENLREHLLRVHVDWPLLLARPPDAALAMRLLRACEGLERDPAQLATLLRLHSLGIPPEEFLRIDDTAALRAWVRAHGASSPAAAMLEHLSTLPPLTPVDPIAALGAMDLGRVRERLDDEQAGRFVAMPDEDGACRETGAHARHADAPLVRALHAEGRELEARYAARLRELAWVALHGVPAPGSEPGIARVETSRGTLLHRIEADAGGRIERWRVVAPTEWNFHPRGVAVRLLRSIPAALDTPRRHRLARLALHVVDPCVSFELVADPRE